MKTHQYQRPDAPAIRQKRDYMTSMLAIVFFILVAVNAMYALPAGETPTGEIDGRWVGQFKTAGVDILIRTRFNNNNNSLNGAISIPQEDKYGLPVTFSPSQDNHITFQFKGKKGVFKFEGKLSKNTINGTISCEDRTSSLTLHRYKVIDKETYQQYIGDYRLEETNQIFLFGRYQNTYMLY
ncbi:MAG: hypothetical protein GY757_35290, partial [bacterium]|nr:hypothetical protein [bacterium]